MTKSTLSSFHNLVTHCTLLACLGSIGCATDEPYETEEVAQDEAALNRECGAVPAQYVYTGKIAPELVTNDYKGGCQGNSIVIDVNNFSAGYTSPWLSLDSVPNNQADCEAIRLGYYVWEKTSAGIEYRGNHWREGGSWTQFGCIIGIFGSPVGLQIGKSYRLAVTARINNVTKTLSIRSQKQIE